MKKRLFMLLVVMTFSCISAVSAVAMNDPVKVGLQYGDTGVYSANLENAVGEGYAFGYFDASRIFVSLGQTMQTTITMTAAGTIYFSNGNYAANSFADAQTLGVWHVQMDGFESFEAAEETAALYGGWPAFINSAYAARTGFYSTKAEADTAAGALGGYAVQSSNTGVLVTVTGTAAPLFEFDCSGVYALGIQPVEYGQAAETWFKGYRYPGAFEYPRVTDGNLYVVNVVGLDDYVKGVIPYEIGTDSPAAAMEAQAVCARTYGCKTRHPSYGFDVCNTTDCQVYYGRGNGSRYPTAQTDAAVNSTAGQVLWYNDELVQTAVYHSSNGGATEDAVNVWGSEIPYLKGRIDPYEALNAPTNYCYAVTYTASELTGILQTKGYSVGTVKNVYVSEFTPMGNVKRITFEGSAGTVTVKGEACRTIFYSSAYGKSVRSMRFGINGSSGVGQTVYINDASTILARLEGVSVISGSGTVSALPGGEVSILSSAGQTTVNGGNAKPTAGGGSTFCIEGAGSGHNIGLSQLGARVMAQQGYSYLDILQFYYTGVTVR